MSTEVTDPIEVTGPIKITGPIEVTGPIKVTESTESEKKEFIQNLLQASQQRKLTKFIKTKLMLNQTEINNREINKNLAALRSMNENEQIIIKAEAHKLKIITTPSYYFTILLAIITILFSIYGVGLTIFSGSESRVFAGVTMVVFSLLIIVVILLYVMYLSKNKVAIYFDFLITNLKYENEEK